MTAIVTGAIRAVITPTAFAGAASHAGAVDSHDAGAATAAAAAGAAGAAGAREKEARRLSAMFVGRWRPESVPEGKVQTVRGEITVTQTVKG